MNVNSFRAEIASRGHQRPELYRVRFFPPPALATALAQNGTDPSETLEFWIDRIAMPGYSMQAHTVRRYGYGTSEKRPVFPVFDDVTMSVVSDEAGENREFFRRWMNVTVSADSSAGIYPITQKEPGLDTYELSYPTEYASRATVTALSRSGEETTVAVLNEAWPIALGPISLQHAPSNDVARFQVTLSIQDWFPGEPDQS